MSTCPICGLEGIPPEKTQCPQCDADLTCFRILDSLPDELPVEEKKLPASPYLFTVIVGLLIALGGALAGFTVHRLNLVELRLNNQQAELAEAMRSIDARLERLVLEQSKLRERYALLSKAIGKAPAEIPEEKKLPASPNIFIWIVGLLVILATGALTGFLLYRFNRAEARLHDRKSELIEFMRSVDARLERLVLEQSKLGERYTRNP